MKAISRDSQQITELLEIGWMVSVVTEMTFEVVALWAVLMDDLYALY